MGEKQRQKGINAALHISIALVGADCKDHSKQAKGSSFQDIGSPAHRRMIVSVALLFDFELSLYKVDRQRSPYSLFSTSAGLLLAAFSVCDPIMMNAISTTAS
jgi:hypothetical protein